MTKNQRQSLYRVLCATRKGEWYRSRSSGERVTLASLYRHHGLIVRRAWRGKEGEADAAYEYQTKREVTDAAKALEVTS